MRHVGTQRFETARLVCRRFVYDDCNDMLTNWASDPDVQSEYGEPVYENVSQVKELLNRYIDGYQRQDYYRWAIIEKCSNSNIGQIAFCRVYSDCETAEIEYCIGKRFWGKGYAGEALAGLIDLAFHNMDFNKLEAYHRSENIRSGRVLEKSPMHITDNVERFLRNGSVSVGEVCYSIERDLI
ncbi:MAG: GNAT family N-acetyltransferase [Oscillospiraceae bacterium]|nr:GNAT family N-acetyltransferase [Oscillospiraceae bacterium]